MFLENMITDEIPANQEEVIRSLLRKIKRQQQKNEYLLKKIDRLYLNCFKLRRKLRESEFNKKCEK